MSDANGLKRRIEERLELHDEQRRLRQNQMQRIRRETDARLQRYTAVADRLIAAVIQPHLKQLAKCFDALNSPQWETTRHTCRLLFKHTPRFPATANIELGVSRDGEGKTVWVQFQASIVPLFVPLEKQDQMTMPLEAVDEATVAAWVDGKLLQFVDTYLHVDTAAPDQEDNNPTNPRAPYPSTSHMLSPLGGISSPTF